MLTYDFKCDTCQRTFEGRHSILDIPDQVPCDDPACTGTARRQIGIGSTVDTRVMDGKFPYVSDRLPRKLKGCKTTGNGKPVIMSRQHEDRVFKEGGWQRE